MHSRYLVELAAVGASQNRELCRLAPSPSFWGGEQYWALSRARLNHWAERLKAIRDQQHGSAGREPSALWITAEPVLEEVFLSEVCTRVWCATLASVDHVSLPGELDPIARSVFVATLEVRRRALRLLLFARGLPGIGTHSINRLRQECESWTDQLLALISPKAIAAQFSFDKRRLRELVIQTRSLGESRLGYERRSARLSSLRYALAARTMLAPVCPELNADICSVILSCLPMSSFDGSGILRPSWSVDTYQSDQLSFSLLADLCGGGFFPPHEASVSFEGRR